MLREVVLSPQPPLPIQGSILNSFGEMRGLDTVDACQVSNGAGHFEDAVIGTGTQAQALQGHLHQLLPRIVQRAVLAYEPTRHLGIAVNARFFRKTGHLRFSRLDHPCPYHR